MSTNPNPSDAAGFWALAYTTNSKNPRAKRWWTLARVVKVDGKWWRLDCATDLVGSNNHIELKARAEAAGYRPILRGHFTPHNGNLLRWSLDPIIDTQGV